MHDFQPKHTKLSKEEIKKLLERLNISLSQLPKVSKEDPAIILQNLEVGEVVRIDRKSEDGDFEYFRVVVK